MVTIVAQDVVKVIVAARERGLTGTAGAKGKLVNRVVRLRLETFNMDVNPLFSILGPADHDHVTLANPACLRDINIFTFEDKDRIHATLGSQQPAAMTKMKVFRMV
jgi:hypothetical protein